jgi:hypothetical protein
MKEIVNLTPDIVLCVQNIADKAPADYRNNDPDAADKIADNQNLSIEICAEENLPKLHAQQREAIDGFVRCAMTYAEKLHPLLPGETVQREYASFLTQSFDHVPISAAVIKRQTNMADLYFIISNVMVDNNGDLFRRMPAEGLRLKGGLKLDYKSLASKAASSLASSIASKIGGAIAGWMIEGLFPPGVPSYFDEVYTEISKLIGKGLQENNITTINGAINSIKDHLITEYEPARKRADLENKQDRKALFALLQKYDTTFLSGPAGMVGTLQSKQYELPGFAAFCLAASLQLALFQEMANVAPQSDPKTGKWLKANETSYGQPDTGTVAINARRYAEYAERVWPALLAERVKGIEEYTYEANKRAVPGDVYWEKWGAIDDHGEAKWQRKLDKEKEKDGSYPTMDHLRRDKDSYIAQVKSDLIKAYCEPDNIIADWRKLIARPILLASAHTS